jgi:hypothetical protein
MLEGDNDSIIILIPKQKSPYGLKDFRPISLCNVVYKVTAKCIVNRMRHVLQEIISLEQSAFVLGRMITDNALIAFVVTQHTTACCSMQVIDITLVKYHFTNITSLRVVQQKHSGLYSST